MKFMKIDLNLSSSARLLLIQLIRKSKNSEIDLNRITELNVVKETLFKDKTQALKDIDELVDNKYLKPNPDCTFSMTENGIAEAINLSEYERSMYWADA